MCCALCIVSFQILVFRNFTNNAKSKEAWANEGDKEFSDVEVEDHKAETVELRDKNCEKTVADVFLDEIVDLEEGEGQSHSEGNQFVHCAEATTSTRDKLVVKEGSIDEAKSTRSLFQDLSHRVGKRSYLQVTD